MIEKKYKTKSYKDKTIIFIPDLNFGGFTSYFKEIPECVAEGETEEQAEKNLIDVYSYMINHKDKQK